MGPLLTGDALEGVGFDERRDRLVDAEHGLRRPLVAPAPLRLAGHRRHVEEQAGKFEIDVSQKTRR